MLVAVVALGGLAAAQSERLQAWTEFDYSKQNIDLRKLQGWGLSDLTLLRAIIFARHGRTFEEPDIKGYLAKQTWYRPDSKFNNASLNAKERENISAVRHLEALKHATVQPGDLRFVGMRKLTVQQFGNPPIEDLLIMRAEIEAIRGRRFNFESLQAYFDERYWYQPVAHYDAAVLSPIERSNAAVLDQMIVKRLGPNISFMGYQTSSGVRSARAPSIKEKLRQQQIEQAIRVRGGG
jgi:hypothetical protein